jgi:formylglycine-generating enzyme
MPPASLRFGALVALLSAAACGEPFIGVAPSVLSDAGGAASVVEVEPTGGAPMGGEAPEPPLEATLGGAQNEAQGGAPTDGGEPSVSAGRPSTGERKCPSLAGEKLALAGSFCIDENEVTVAHYRAFLDSSPSVLEQPPACAANVTFANNCKFTSAEKEPQRCVDWCDARAYCTSVGKRLCGSAEGGAMAFDAVGDASQDQWYDACSHAGEVAYPYGSEYDGAACWGADRPGVGALTVRSASGCVGGYEGVWDMSGGLAEWVDSCDAESGPTDACRIRGGSSSGAPEQLRCDAVTATARGTSSSYIGFRCCAELLP